MFKKLQEKWGLSTRTFWIVFIAFGLTGTTTAFLTRYVTQWLGMDANSDWYYRLGVRLFMLLFGYQVILLTYGFLLGQWAFFWKYELKLLRKLKILPRAPLKTPIAIFASGAGSNALKIMQHFEEHPTISVHLIVCNKPGAGVIHHAEKQGVPVLLIEKERFFRGDAYIPVLQQHRISFIVLAGFLWKIPAALVAAYPNKMLNIHPALLPNFGGKGMYGEYVHRAVLDSGEKESGISIHLVNEHFDEGEVIFQSSCPIEANETPHSLAQKIHQLEHAHYPRVIEQFVQEKIKASES
jgi:formyltetrahydrofolate-dependent phosphoribosylglycinamide formyltransferase